MNVVWIIKKLLFSWARMPDLKAVFHCAVQNQKWASRNWIWFPLGENGPFQKWQNWIGPVLTRSGQNWSPDLSGAGSGQN